MKKLLAAAVCAGASVAPSVMAPAVGSAATTGPAAQLACGTVITSSVTLTADMTCPDLALGVDGTDVILDLGGHTIRSLGGQATLGIGGADVTVTDGTVVPPPGGQDAYMPTGLGETFRAVTFDGGFIVSVHDTTAFVGDTMLHGAAIYGTETIVSIAHSRFSGTPADGPAISVRFTDLSVTDSTIRGFATGIWLHSDSGSADFEHNRIVGTGVGIEVDNGANPGLIADNVVAGSWSDGILLGWGAGAGRPGQAPPGIIVRGNQVTSNGGDGIRVSLAPTQAYTGVPINVTLTGNRAYANGNWGIESPGTIPAQNVYVTDGGGNLAAGNGQPAQCLNVVCRPDI